MKSGDGMNRPATFAERLNYVLDMKQITKAELSRMTGISKSSLTRYTKGDWEGKQDAVYAIARALHVDEAWLMGYDVPMERPEWIDPLITSCIEETKSGRSAAKEEMYRLFGTEHETSELRFMGGNQVAMLYYRVMERNKAAELHTLVDMIDQKSTDDIDTIYTLVEAYFKAAQPIRDIVDTALKPYRREEYDEDEE